MGKFTFSLREININSYIGDSDNPRHLKDNVADLLELSLRKYGLLSPIYVTGKGLILSGHQRTATLRRMGETKSYVTVLPSITTKSTTNAVNFAFNKELQEILSYETPNPEEMDKMRANLESMPDLEDKFQRLKNMELVEVGKIKCNQEVSKRLIDNSKLLFNKAKVVMPLIVDENYNIINGIPRFKLYEKKFKQVPCIVVKGLDANIFRYITAQYSFDSKEDNIRQEQRRHHINYFIGNETKQLLLGRKAHKYDSYIFYNYMQRQFPRMLEFGSGNGKQTAFMRNIGIDITLFEPFVNNFKGGISLSETYQSLNNTLDSLEKCEPFDFVRASMVLNSVPFEADRLKVVVLMKFLAAGSKVLMASSRSKNSMGSALRRATATKVDMLSDNAMVSTGIKTKIQRFHDYTDMVEMFNPVGDLGQTIIENSNSIFIKIDKPKYVLSKAEVLEAIAFEFGMNYSGRNFEDIKLRALSVAGKVYDVYVDKGYIIPC